MVFQIQEFFLILDSGFVLNTMPCKQICLKISFLSQQNQDSIFCKFEGTEETVHNQTRFILDTYYQVVTGKWDDEYEILIIQKKKKNAAIMQILG